MHTHMFPIPWKRKYLCVSKILETYVYTYASMVLETYVYTYVLKTLETNLCFRDLGDISIYIVRSDTLGTYVCTDVQGLGNLVQDNA